MMGVNEQKPGVLIPEGFSRIIDGVGVSSPALCSVFIEDRDLTLVSGPDRFQVSRQLFGAFSDRVPAASSDRGYMDVHSSELGRIVRLLRGETVIFGGV
jgi:hypothetical protein